MTGTLSLVRREDMGSDIDSISLLDYTNGLQLADGGWQQGIAAPSDQSISETFTLRAKGSSQNNLAAVIQALDAKVTQVYWYQNPQERYSVWLRSKLDSETNTRQALVKALTRSPAPLMTNLNNKNFVIQTYAVALERMPWWESTSLLDYSQSGAGTISSLGGKWDYTTYGGSPGAVPGDQPARIAQAILTGVAGTGPLTKAWVGFRTDRLGARANFVPLWNQHLSVDGGRSDADTTSVGDANAADGHKTTTTFATVATMARRNILRVSDFIPATPNDARGTFMVLLRAKVSAGANVNVRLADGYFSSSNLAVRPRVNITSTSYYIYELGTVKIPSPGRTISGYDLSNYALALDAERISVSGSLDADTFILIPIDEGYLTTDQPDASVAGFGDGFGGVAGGAAHWVFERPDGAVQGVYLGNAQPSGNIITRYFNGLPTGNGIAVVAAQRLTSSVKADTMSLEFLVYPRWNTLRGSS